MGFLNKVLKKLSQNVSGSIKLWSEVKPMNYPIETYFYKTLAFVSVTRYKNNIIPFIPSKVGSGRLLLNVAPSIE